MIDRIWIQGLRGIREATLNGLSELTILVGQNGAGKSTILEALAVAASPTPADAVGRIVRRRTSVANGAPWLLWRANEMEKATISINSNRPDDRAFLAGLLETHFNLQSRPRMVWAAPSRKGDLAIPHEAAN